MPINKDSLKRFQIIDKLLSDPNKDYTTKAIHEHVIRSCKNVSLRMIQIDLHTIEDEFGKKLVRNKGGKGTVKYEDQAEPIFYKQLSDDEEVLLKAVMKSLGQFEGMDNFASLDLLKKKLDLDCEEDPIIAFSRNEGLQMPKTLLARLFTAISLKKVIQVTYTRFGSKPQKLTVYPYLLKQYNDRWFLLCTPLANDEHPYDPEFIINLALDRMEESFDYVEKEPYIQTPVNLKERFDEIIGVTLNLNNELEDLVFAVKPESLRHVQTKWLHNTQIEFDSESQIEYREKYPSLKDCTFFSIECRPNWELYSRFSSYGQNVVLVEPEYMRKKMKDILSEAANNYQELK